MSKVNKVMMVSLTATGAAAISSTLSFQNGNQVHASTKANHTKKVNKGIPTKFNPKVTKEQSNNKSHPRKVKIESKANSAKNTTKKVGLYNRNGKQVGTAVLHIDRDSDGFVSRYLTNVPKNEKVSNLNSAATGATKFTVENTSQNKGNTATSNRNKKSQNNVKPVVQSAKKLNKANEKKTNVQFNVVNKTTKSKGASTSKVQTNKSNNKVNKLDVSKVRKGHVSPQLYSQLLTSLKAVEPSSNKNVTKNTVSASLKDDTATINGAVSNTGDKDNNLNAENAQSDQAATTTATSNNDQASADNTTTATQASGDSTRSNTVSDNAQTNATDSNKSSSDQANSKTTNSTPAMADKVNNTQRSSTADKTNPVNKATTGNSDVTKKTTPATNTITQRQIKSNGLSSNTSNNTASSKDSKDKSTEVKSDPSKTDSSKDTSSKSSSDKKDDKKDTKTNSKGDTSKSSSSETKTNTTDLINLQDKKDKKNGNNNSSQSSNSKNSTTDQDKADTDSSSNVDKNSNANINAGQGMQSDQAQQAASSSQGQSELPQTGVDHSQRTNAIIAGSIASSMIAAAGITAVAKKKKYY